MDPAGSGAVLGGQAEVGLHRAGNPLLLAPPGLQLAGMLTVLVSYPLIVRFPLVSVGAWSPYVSPPYEFWFPH